MCVDYSAFSVEAMYSLAWGTLYVDNRWNRISPGNVIEHDLNMLPQLLCGSSARACNGKLGT